jgi:microcystin-dependent protein
VAGFGKELFMATPYIGEIRLVGFNFAPVNWAFCDGTLQAISQNEALYTLLGTTYGGDGTSTFALPDLRGRVPIHQGTYQANSYIIGQRAGTETVTLTTNQIAAHNHPLQASTTVATSPNPTNNLQAATQSVNAYVTPTAVTPMSSVSTASGGSQPHENMQPYLVVNFIIALFGVFPSQG